MIGYYRNVILDPERRRESNTGLERKYDFQKPKRRFEMVLKLNKGLGIVLLVLLAFMLAPASGWSQEYGFEQQAEQSEVSADDIASFAKAQDRVAKIRGEYEGRLSDVEDQMEHQEIVQEMSNKLVAAVQKEGLSVEKYNEILSAAQRDPALKQRISEVMQAIQ
jgi:hypothetical protein